MILITLGSQKFQFNRILEKVDELIEKGAIKDEVFAQIGYSTYIPKNFKYSDFLSRDDFRENMDKADIVITHGGTGAIITAIKKGKRTIAVPRLSKYKEHVDDHQLEIVRAFDNKGYIQPLFNLNDLEDVIKKTKNAKFKKYKSNTNKFIRKINEYINEPEKKKVLMLGPCLSVKGGMTAVVESYYKIGLDKKVDLKFMGTVNDKNNFSKAISMFCGFIKFMKEIKSCDIVHINVACNLSTYRKGMYARIARKYKKKVILHIHGSEFMDFYNNGSDKRKNFIKATLNSADKVIVLSREWKKFFSDFVDKKKLVVINNSITIPKKFKKRDKSKLLFLGKIGSRKGVFDLIEAMENVVKRYPKIKLYIGGDGKIKELMKLIETKHLSKNVKYIGWVKDKEKEKYLKQSSIYILPSYNEGVPMSILEAMSYENAVISTRVGGIPSIIKNNRTGILIKAGDVNQLEKSIINLIKYKHKREKLAKNARDFVSDKHDISKNIDKLVGLYNKV